MLRPDRSRDREVRHLEWRIRLFGVGAILGLVGIATEIEWFIWGALAVLLVGFVLRFLPGEGEGGEEGTEEGDVHGAG